MADGYIRLHRQLIESYQFSNPENLKIWVWMLLKANYKSKSISLNIGNGYADINVERGQFVFGRASASKDLKMHESKIYRVIKKLERDGSISIKSNNKFSIITICKYDDYNNPEFETEQQVNNRRTTGEQQVNTTKKDKKEKKGKEEEYIGLAEACLTIVNYLNENAETSFRSTSSKNKTLISARLNEGYTIENFKDVIDSKIKEWKSDVRMKIYLRPETLFGGKFEGYVGNLPKVVKLGPSQSIDKPMSDEEYEEYMRPKSLFNNN